VHLKDKTVPRIVRANAKNLGMKNKKEIMLAVRLMGNIE
jgi:hypothetical protein